MKYREERNGLGAWDVGRSKNGDDDGQHTAECE